MRRFTVEEKMYAVKKRFEEGMSFRGIAGIMGADESSIRSWCLKYESEGIKAFTRCENRKYSLEFKKSAVEYYLSGNGSLNQTCKVFCIPSTYPLRQWIQLYNSHELKASPGGKGQAGAGEGAAAPGKDRVW